MGENCSVWSSLDLWFLLLPSFFLLVQNLSLTSRRGARRFGLKSHRGTGRCPEPLLVQAWTRCQQGNNFFFFSLFDICSANGNVFLIYISYYLVVWMSRNIGICRVPVRIHSNQMGIQTQACDMMFSSVVGMLFIGYCTSCGSAGGTIRQSVPWRESRHCTSQVVFRWHCAD